MIITESPKATLMIPKRTIGREKLALLFKKILPAMNNSKFNCMIISAKVLIYKDLVK